MNRKASGIILILFLIGSFSLVFYIPSVKATGTIYIRADGSIDPPTAPIQRNGDIYTLTGNITSDPLVAGGIVIERGNIILDGAGYTLQGSGSGIGLSWSGVNNVAIKNTNIKNYSYGVRLVTSYTNYNTISGNNITNNGVGMQLGLSSSNIISGNNITANNSNGVSCYTTDNNTISGNTITANSQYGIVFTEDSRNNSISGNNIANNLIGVRLSHSPNNTISGNTITANSDSGIELRYLDTSNTSISGNNITNNLDGVRFFYCSNNTVSGNNIANNVWGVRLEVPSQHNSIFHNDFANNDNQVYSDGLMSIWDDGYPSGGNFWSDYTGVDTNSDGIGDTPYVIDETNQDRYPLMSPWTPSLTYDVAITSVVRSKTVVGQGYSNSINVTAANQGSKAETFNVTVYSGDRFYDDPFDVWNYTGAWRYFDPDAAEGYVSVGDGMLHVSGYWNGGYQEGGLTTIKEFNYPITVETKLRSNSASHSPCLSFGQDHQPGWIGMQYDSYDGGWHVVCCDTTGEHDFVWGGSINVGTWYTLKLVVNESNFKAYLDDVLKVDRDWLLPQEHPKTISLRSTYGWLGSGDFDWVKIETKIATQTITLESGASKTLTFTWDTTSFAKGNYPIWAYAEPVLGETDTADNTFVDGLVKVTIPGDINGDFFVNIADVGQITANWLKRVPPAPANADVNGDGIINISDVGPIATNWLKHA